MSSIPQHDSVVSPTDSARSTPSFAPWQLILRYVPTAVVVVGLAALAVWGHFADWKLPKFSALVDAGAATPDDWCQTHNVPEADCIECNLERFPPGTDYGWCKDHGISQCPFEH